MPQYREIHFEHDSESVIASLLMICVINNVY